MMRVIADFKVGHKAELDQKLDAAVEAAHAYALTDRRRGVLVTRHDYSHFTVALSPSVPFGIIREDDQSRRN